MASMDPGQVMARASASNQATKFTGFLNGLNTHNGGQASWECKAVSKVANPAAGGANPTSDGLDVSTDCEDTGQTPDAVQGILSGLQALHQHSDTNGTTVDNNVAFGAHPHADLSVRQDGADPASFGSNGFSSATATAGGPDAPH